MPTYDYHCLACGHALELFHGMSEPARKKCPRCGKNKLERRIGAGAGFLFKGSGFYLTDYRSESYKEGAKRDDAGSAKPDASAPAAASDSTPAKSESKPASKPASKPRGKKKD
ncbi:MAG: zinc ribbon domain-containing protein [Planctomycetes bacterium]|nr:zinc ribbon domain-containing protein [Planctomycetota bacterium]